jgi:hypothetical protein
VDPVDGTSSPGLFTAECNRDVHFAMLLPRNSCSCKCQISKISPEETSFVPSCNYEEARIEPLVIQVSVYAILYLQDPLNQLHYAFEIRDSIPLTMSGCTNRIRLLNETKEEAILRLE